MLVAATSPFDLVLGAAAVALSLVFAYGLVSGRTNRSQVGVAQATTLTAGFFFLGLGRLLGSDALGAVGLVGVIGSAYFRFKEKRRRRR